MNDCCLNTTQCKMQPSGPIKQICNKTWRNLLKTNFARSYKKESCQRQERFRLKPSYLKLKAVSKSRAKLISSKAV